MSVLGLRASSAEIRYAILEKDVKNNIIFKNRNGENRLKYPSTCNLLSDKIAWVKYELDRILRTNPDISKIVIKINEYGTPDTSARRESSYMEAIFILCAKEHGINVETKLYTQMSTSSRKVQDQAEQLFGRLDKYWNVTISDALISAYREVIK